MITLKEYEVLEQYYWQLHRYIMEGLLLSSTQQESMIEFEKRIIPSDTLKRLLEEYSLIDMGLTVYSKVVDLNPELFVVGQHNDLEKDKTVYIVSSPKVAASIIGVKPKSIKDCCNNKTKATKGYEWYWKKFFKIETLSGKFSKFNTNKINKTLISQSYVVGRKQI